MARAVGMFAACLLGFLAFACAPRQQHFILPPQPEPALPEGQQSLEDLGRTLDAGGPALVATVDRSERFSDKSAEVRVTVAGIGLIDPHLSGEYARDGQGHLHYKVDDGPVVATTATRLSFQDLTPGRHTIVVSLAGNDHRPIGPKRILTISIPSDGTKPQRTRKRSSSPKARDQSNLSAR